MENLHKSMYVKGTTKKMKNVDQEEAVKQKKPFFFIIMPNSLIKKFWSAVI